MARDHQGKRRRDVEADVESTPPRKKQCPLRRLLSLGSSLNPTVASNTSNVQTLSPEIITTTSGVSERFNSASIIRSLMPISSVGIGGIASRVPSVGARPLTSRRRRTLSPSNSSLQRSFDEVVVGIGAHMENPMSRLIATSGLDRHYDNDQILQWRTATQYRHLYLHPLEHRRHTAPATFPIQRSSDLF